MTPSKAALALAIIESVAAHHLVPVKDVLGPSRKAPIARARHEAMARIRFHLELSHPQIGAIFSRGHDTVIRGIRRHRAGHPVVKFTKLLTNYHTAYHPRVVERVTQDQGHAPQA